MMIRTRAQVKQKRIARWMRTRLTIGAFFGVFWQTKT